MASEATQHAADAAQHGGSFPPFDGSTFPSQLLWLAITFGFLYYVMSKIALPRIAAILEDRQDKIAGDLGEAERLKHETEAAIAAYEQALTEARDKAHGIAQSTRAKLDADVAAKRDAVEAKLNDKLAEAQAQIGEIKTAALAQIGDIATETTQELVKAMIGTSGTKAEVAKAVSESME